MCTTKYMYTYKFKYTPLYTYLRAYLTQGNLSGQCPSFINKRSRLTGKQQIKDEEKRRLIVVKIRKQRRTNIIRYDYDIYVV